MRGCNKFKSFYKNKLYNKAIYLKGSKSAHQIHNLIIH